MNKLTTQLPGASNTLLDHSLGVLREVFPSVVLSVHSEKLDVGVECLSDPTGFQGPVAGVVAGLRHFKAPLFVMSADMPDVTPKLVRVLCEQHSHPGVERLVPEGSHGVEPLFGIYFPGILPVLEARAGRGEFSLQSLSVREQIVSQEVLIQKAGLTSWGFRSLNTPDDVRQYRQGTGEILAE